MNIHELLQTLSDRIAGSASIKNVYGEPVTVGNRTIIPVARVTLGFGGGAGEEKGAKEGHGGGGRWSSCEPVWCARDHARGDAVHPVRRPLEDWRRDGRRASLWDDRGAVWPWRRPEARIGVTANFAAKPGSR
jgi:hypothetical protein